MNRKDLFLRDIQLIEPPRPDSQTRLAFGWALNLGEKSIPRDIPKAARKFVRELYR